MLRIAMVSPYSVSVPGGVQAQVLGLARELRRIGHEVRVLAPCDGPPPEPFVTPLGNSLPTAANGSVAPLAPDPSAAMRTIRALNDEAFDVIHLHEPIVPGPTVTALLLKLAPTVGTFHAAGDSTSYRVLNKTARWAAEHLTVRVAVSESAKELASRYLDGEYTVLFNGIEVQRLTADASVANATMYAGGTVPTMTAKAGNYVVDLAQPQGYLAKALLEPDAALDSAFIKFELELRRTGQRNRFYDMTAWSLPLAWRVDAYALAAVPGSLAMVTDMPRTFAAPARSVYGYAFAPGSEASIRLLASLLTDSVRVWYAPYSFTSKTNKFPNGAFVIRTALNRADVHDVVLRRAAEAGAQLASIPSAGVDEGTDLGSNSVIPVQRPKVALLGGAPVNGSSFGFAWYAMDQRIGYASTLVDANFVASGDMSAFNTLIVPSVQAGALDRVLGDAGRARLAEWVRSGGVLITMDAASAWVAQERVGLVRTRVKRDSTRADSTGGAPLPGSLPGVLARATVDSLSPLMAGVLNREMPVFVNSDRVFTIPKDLAAGDAVMRFAPAARVRIAGYYWPEAAAKLGGSPYLWTERAGRGRVIMFAHDPVYRDQLRGTLPIFANAVLLGGSY